MERVDTVRVVNHTLQRQKILKQGKTFIKTKFINEILTYFFPIAFG